MAVKGTYLPTLMIIVEKPRFIFFKKNQKLSVHSKALRPMLKMKQAEQLKLFALIVVENFVQMNLMFFVTNMVFRDNSQ